MKTNPRLDREILLRLFRHFHSVGRSETKATFANAKSCVYRSPHYAVELSTSHYSSRIEHCLLLAPTWRLGFIVREGIIRNTVKIDTAMKLTGVDEDFFKEWEDITIMTKLLT